MAHLNFQFAKVYKVDLIKKIGYNQEQYTKKQVMRKEYLIPQRQERIFEPMLFKQYLRSKLISLLDSIPGKKLVMLEPAARIPINLISDRKLFQEHGVMASEGGVTSFEPMMIEQNYDQIVVFLSPTPQNLKTLKQLITINMQKGNKKYYPCFWPKRTLACKEFLESAKLLDVVDMKDFSFDLLPLDIDLYSLEMKNLKEQYVNNNNLIYTTVAESIHRLQCVFGKIHNIFGKGKAARAIYEILRLKQNEIKTEEVYGDIEHLIMVDRNIDWVTPLLKQMTYEGLIDECFGIEGNVVKVPTALLEETSSPTKDGKNQPNYRNLLFNSQKDYIYEQVRLLTINGARMALKTRGAQFDKFTQDAKQILDINQKAQATKRIQTQRQFLKKHLQMNSILMEEIKTIGFQKELIMQQKCVLQSDKEIIDYMENLIPFEIPIEKILRSMALQCIIEKGISKKTYARICDDLVFTYGMQHILSLTNLANLGLFFAEGSISSTFNFSDVKKELKLISDSPINHENPTDTSFAYGGYTPIITRLVEAAVRGGWRTIQKALKMLPGETILPEYVEECTSHPKPVVLVYFIGGVTYGQIATLRLLAKILRKEIVIATTEIINGQKMIKNLIESEITL